MKESYGEGPAPHTGPESCVGVRKGDGETLTGGRAGRVFSRERHSLQSADAVRRSGRRYPTRRQRKTWRGSARSETPSMPRHTLRENRERPGVPVADGAAGAVREAHETPRHVKAAAGVDGETWGHYGQALEANLADVSGRLKRGAYRVKPVKRTYIPKADGRQRPLGIPTLEDKLVQRATVEVMNAIYETDFLGFSYGFRPGRNAHNALDVLYAGILTRKVNWVLDADIRGFFEAMNHEWLVKFVEHRIADRRVVRLIQKWLSAGVLEDGTRIWREEGTRQGGSISPLLANVYLHYVFDLWAHRWRKTHAHGDVIVVRYADDFIVEFQHRADAERFLTELRERFTKFGLELHPEKTRLLEFGPFAARDRQRAGQGKPETFNFLGFTHICGKKRNGRFTVVRQTIRTRLQAKLRAVKAELRRRLHAPIPEVGRWLRSVVEGHLRYYGVPMNRPALLTFCFQVGRLWYRTLRRRSQTARITWERMRRLIRRWLPPPRICHPYPLRRLGVVT